jgi:integrase
MPGRSSRAVAQLFTWAALRPFWELAVAGELRHLVQHVGRPLPVASQRVVRDCLGILAGVAVPGKRVRLPVLEQAELKPTVTAGQLTAVYRELVDMAGRGPLEFDGVSMPVDERARLLAMVAVVLDAAPRTGELTAMRLPDVGPDEEWVRVVRRPQNRRDTARQDDIAAGLGVSRTAVAYALSPRPELRAKVSEATRQAVAREVEQVDTGPVVERYALREGTRVALRRWLRVRERVVDPLEGGKSAVWVTLHASKAGPPGLPISGEGLGDSYTRGMTALNMLMAGSYGWEPMPTTLDRLRRSVWPLPLEESEDGSGG